MEVRAFYLTLLHRKGLKRLWTAQEGTRMKVTHLKVGQIGFDIVTTAAAGLQIVADAL